MCADLIKRASFAKQAEDKTKLNWFLYTFACRLYNELNNGSDLVWYTDQFHMEYVEEYYPSIRSDRCIELLRAAMTAFDSLLDQCVVCPVRCISERNEPISLFEPMPPGGAFRFDSLAYCLRKKAAD